MNRPAMTLTAVVLGAPNARELAAFCRDLLGWEVRSDEPEVDDLAAATEYAASCGATMADFQPQDNVRVFLDPAGHPFCIWVPD